MRTLARCSFARQVPYGVTSAWAFLENHGGQGYWNKLPPSGVLGSAGTQLECLHTPQGLLGILLTWRWTRRWVKPDLLLATRMLLLYYHTVIGSWHCTKLCIAVTSKPKYVVVRRCALFEQPDALFVCWQQAVACSLAHRASGRSTVAPDKVLNTVFYFGITKSVIHSRKLPNPF